MNTFTNAVQTQTTFTTNGMVAYASSGNALTDLFSKIGASRGKNIIPDFVAAFVEDSALATRIALWARDVRGGAGERKIFRDILQHLETASPDTLEKIFAKIPELGRWDDLFVFNTKQFKDMAFSMVRDALLNNDGLCAKWCPREKSAKKQIASELRTFLGWTPKFYRKRISELTKVVEQQMCANQWDDINFSHVPSLAHSRLKKAFGRHTSKYGEYVAALTRGDTSVKINAGAVFPYDVLKGVSNWNWRHDFTKTELDAIIAQWNALPNFVGDAKILPLVDVSGSMTQQVGKNSAVTCMDVAVSLGLYLSDKNTGPFNGTFLTFSSAPKLIHLEGNIVQKVQQMVGSEWGMSTNLEAALRKILTVAIQGNVPQEEMPEFLLILSDMQFNACVKNAYSSALDMVRSEYASAGYTMPNVVFWNLNSHDNTPAKCNEEGVALVSGFSPAITKAVLEADRNQFTPMGIMMKTIMNPRYDF